MNSEEIESLRRKAEMMDRTSQLSRSGWWYANFTTNKYEFSDYLRSFTELDSNEITMDDFRDIIHPNYQERIAINFELYQTTGIFEETFIIMTKFGYRWVNSKLGAKEIDQNGDTTALGHMRLLDEVEVATLTSDNLSETIKLSFDKYSSILSSLILLLNHTNSDGAIHQTLTDILNLFDGNRVYIFEYDFNNNDQTCTYEVCSEHCTPQKEFLANIQFEDTPWWSKMLKRKMPIILNTLDDLPKEAASERELLEMQNIKSLLVVPLITNDKTFGYLGIEVVNEQRIWSTLDKQWLLAIANMISMCLELKRMHIYANGEKKRLSDLYENMPMGFIRMKILFDENGKPNDLLYLENNNFVDKFILKAGTNLIGKLASEVFPISLSMLDEIQVLIDGNVAISNNNFNIGNGESYAYTCYSTGNNEFGIIFHDNTESVLTQTELKKSKTKLDEIFQNVPVGIEIYDKDGYLLEMNDVGLTIFGVNREDIIGKINLFENPNAPKTCLDELRKGDDINIELKYDYDNITKTGYYNTTLSKTKNISVKGTAVYDQKGEIEYFLLVSSDNTETTTISDKLLNFEMVFDSIAEFSEIGLCRYNPDRNKFLATDQWLNNLCSDRSGDIFSSLYENLYEEDIHRIEKLINDIITGEISSFRTELRVKTGESDKWLKCLFNRTKNNNQSRKDYEIVGLNIDITGLKNTEIKLTEAKIKAEESDRLKSAFVANMSHEIRTPLNAIVGFSEMLVSSDDVDEKELYISIIKQNNNLLLQLISDILDISRIESGIISISPEEININTLCEELAYSNRIKLRDNNVELTFKNNESNCFIYNDKSKLIQILTNFIGNAIKFTEKGFIQLSYTIEDNSIIFSVKDSGKGISKENLSKIFNRFIKLNSFVQGSGLGLSICRSLAEKLGGSIWAESIEGEGSCFCLKLPFDHNLNQNVVDIKVEIEALSMECSKYHTDKKPIILVAEDNDSNYLLLAAILKKEYELVRANNGQEAIDLYKTISPDIILMDMLMPIVDGREATMEIRKIDNLIPIIAVTANAFDQDRKKALEIGCNDYISKPVNAAVLRGLIKKLLD